MRLISSSLQTILVLCIFIIRGLANLKNAFLPFSDKKAQLFLYSQWLDATLWQKVSVDAQFSYNIRSHI